ncbi:sugar porter family MFS transporter [Vibrio viridaestus]|uniref:D-xylose-proton symporter n=1 Tax=Vibrio viridaestus TaxID=2487322 RepID=A0A3N9TMH8_9VIBR|nr:sugar porter family MFS transporter [Vibrio viridaestus]RQW64845.1 MFS transporter [Vibrio viridaestus]
MLSSKSYNLRYILLICGVAALGGLLLGYDTAVISGAINPIQTFFQLDSFGVGWAVSNVAIGCILGALGSGSLATKVGRKYALIIAAVLFTISALGAALVDSFFWFIVYRMIGGVAVGIASAVSPMYMTEISPKDIRGRALSMQNFAIVGGQVVIFFVNFMIAKGATEAWMVDYGWRVMIGSEVIPCLAFCFFAIFIPESPRWLVMESRDKEAHKVLTKIGGNAYADKLLLQIKDAIAEDEKKHAETLSARDLMKQGRFWFFAFLACSVAFFQQASGVNVMMYFAPVVLERVTGSTETAMFLTIWVGVIQLLGTAVGSVLMDKVGRIPLLKIGSLGSVVGLMVTSYFIYQSSAVTGGSAMTSGYLTLFGMMLFMLFYSFSWSLGAWIVISELFPNRMRSFGMSLAVTALWLSNFLVGLGFPILNDNAWLNEHFHGAFPMWLFAGFMAISYYFLYRYLPETNGIQLEKMEKHVINYANRFKNKGKSETTVPAPMSKKSKASTTKWKDGGKTEVA